MNLGLPADLPGSESDDDIVLKYRSIWISDIHLGTRGCQAERLLDFLRHTESDYLYLVGDIVDGWHLRRRWYWPQAHNDVVQKILRRARHGTKVFYIPGNHDEAARPFCGLHFGGVYVVNEIVHETAAGKRILVLHGDQFDAVIGYAKWLAHLGDKAYDLALFINRIFNQARKRLGLPYWSLSSYLKHKVKTRSNISVPSKNLLPRAPNINKPTLFCAAISIMPRCARLDRFFI